MPTEVIEVAPKLSLYEIEHDLLALLDSEALVKPEDEETFRVELAAKMKASVAKRDRVYQFIQHCETLRDAAKVESKRLAERAKLFERVQDRVEKYIVRVIADQGQDEKGKYPKLECNLATFSVRQNPASVAILDEGAIPTRYKSITLTVPYDVWLDHLRVHNELREFFKPEDATGMTPKSKLETAIKRSDVTVDKSAIKKDLEAGNDVNGADLRYGDLALRVS